MLEVVPPEQPCDLGRSGQSNELVPYQPGTGTEVTPTAVALPPPFPFSSLPQSTEKKESTTLSHSAYTVGWVCALSKEQTAATSMLEHEHSDLPVTGADENPYTLGSIGKHNVVIACLPMGNIGTNSAASVATQMVNTFPSIKIVLMVGIGGGIPSNKVRLGDVVVSTPTGQFPGVVQWDFGKATTDGFKCR